MVTYTYVFNHLSTQQRLFIYLQSFISLVFFLINLYLFFLAAYAKLRCVYIGRETNMATFAFASGCVRHLLKIGQLLKNNFV